MQKNQFEICVPFFCGFYESPLYNCDTLYWETYGDELDFYRERFEDDTLEQDDLDIDFDRYKEDVCKTFIDAFFNLCECPDFIEGMDFSEMTSPRYYNFETDKLYANVNLAEDWRDKVKEFMDKNKEMLTKRISEDWTSRDGFWSYMDNTFDYWYNEFQKDEPDERYISSIIQYMMEDADKNVYDHVICDTLENVYLDEYIINTKEEKSSN